MFSNSFTREARILGVALVFAFAAAAAQASPIDLFFDGSVLASDGNPYGLSAQAQADFLANGGQVIVPNSLGLVGSTLTITNPVDITSNYIPGGPDFIANPAQNQNDWQFTANQPLTDVWIVFRGHDPTDVLGANNIAGGYQPQNVGLNLDPMSTTDIWRMINLPAGGGEPATSYLALYLGDLTSGQSVTKSLQYRVTQDILTNTSGDLQFPKHLVGLMFAPVPEPGIVVLLVTTGLGLALRRRLV